MLGMASHGYNELIHWGQVMIYAIKLGHLCLSEDNSLSTVQFRAIFWTSDGFLLIEPSETHLSQFLIK